MADDSQISNVGGRYANALFDLAQDQKALAKVEADLKSLKNALADSRDLRMLLESPAFGAEDKAKGLAAITDVAMRRLFAPEFQADHPDLMADRRAAFLRTDPEVFRAACDALAALDLRPELGNVRVPVLVLVGEHDEATPPPMSQELAAGLPQARLEIIPGCAHVPQLQSPDVFLDAIGGFLSSPKLHAAAG